MAACRAEMRASGLSPLVRPFLAIRLNATARPPMLSLRLHRNVLRPFRGFQLFLFLILLINPRSEMRETERETQRDTERHRETQRETERERERERDRERQRETERDRERQSERKRERKRRRDESDEGEEHTIRRPRLQY